MKLHPLTSAGDRPHSSFSQVALTAQAGISLQASSGCIDGCMSSSAAIRCAGCKTPSCWDNCAGSGTGACVARCNAGYSMP